MRFSIRRKFKRIILDIYYNIEAYFYCRLLKGKKVYVFKQVGKSSQAAFSYKGYVVGVRSANPYSRARVRINITSDQTLFEGSSTNKTPFCFEDINNFKHCKFSSSTYILIN